MSIMAWKAWWQEQKAERAHPNHVQEVDSELEVLALLPVGRNNYLKLSSYLHTRPVAHASIHMCVHKHIVIVIMMIVMIIINT